MTVIKAAAVQLSPVLYSREGTVEKVCRQIIALGRQGVQFATFPETVVPYYPYFAFVQRPYEMGPEHHRLLQQAVTVPSGATRAIGEACEQAGMVVSIGVNERDGGTLYNTQLLFDADGALIQRRRKILPTYHERMIWGQGDGSGLRAVATNLGRIGGLICWEHWMPLARQVLHQSGEDIHIAAWPQVKEMNLIASRHYAFEGRCFVIACGAVMRASELPSELEPIESLKQRPDSFVLNGGSAIIAPDGSLLAGPVFEEEVILTADVDLSRIAEESLALDVSGHYSRPDIFEVKLRS
jgi:aliphatic nitrilase